MHLPEEFFLLHRGIPREGPGSDEATLKAFNMLPELPDSPKVLDLGCGPGKQTLVLARALKVPITAIDIHSQYLEQLDHAAKEAGLDELVTTRQISMDALDYPEESIDLIWSEGAIFILGFRNGLRTWRRFLKPGGLLAVTEVSWLTDSPSPETLDYFTAGYPEMGSIQSNIESAGKEGYDVFHHFVLPKSAWWDEYYTPLTERARELKPGARGVLLEIIEENEKEIDMFERHGDEYGLVFYLMKRTT